jgi:hypothetical protein
MNCKPFADVIYLSQRDFVSRIGGNLPFHREISTPPNNFKEKRTENIMGVIHAEIT